MKGSNVILMVESISSVFRAVIFMFTAGVAQNFVEYPWWNTNLIVKAPHVSIKPLSGEILLGIGCQLLLGSPSLVPLQS